MTKDIRNALIINNMCLTFDNNITFQNQVQSHILTLHFYIMAIPEFLCGVSIFFFQFTIFNNLCSLNDFVCLIRLNLNSKS